VTPQTIPNFVNGQWMLAWAVEALEVSDPATGELLARTPLSGAAEVDAAVAAARRAFPDWRATPPAERARVLFRLRGLLDAHRDELAASITREHGKTLAEAHGELQRGIESVEYACGLPTLLFGDTLESVAPGIDCATFRQPLGVFAAITPYNFPVMIPLWFWPAAVAAGNTFVLKPSEQDPLTHQRIVELASAAGLPPGVLNVVHGGRETVSAILDHPDIVGVSFVGSSAVAQAVYTRGAANGKRVQALGGAKNHMIVLPDADLDATSEAIVASVYGATGQRCLAGSVVVGVGDGYDTLRDRVVQRAAALRVGCGRDPDVDMGPLISARHRERVLGYIAAGERGGARLVLDGRGRAPAAYPRGHWLGPSAFEDVTPDMDVGRDEIFGPVVGFARASSLRDALGLVHRSPYGNAVSLFTTSGHAAREFRYAAGISMIGVNVGVVAPVAYFPFGGSRGSFYGDLKAQGRDAIGFYTDQRVVVSRWPRTTNGA
jgi:malonate-semialdehyde dehydrogenase (acetylating)/methylmalonate-semialdehyde dehydrogenase